MYSNTNYAKNKKIKKLNKSIEHYQNLKKYLVNELKEAKELKLERTSKNVTLYEEYQKKIDDKLDSFEIDYPTKYVTLKTKDALEVNLWINSNRLFFIITNNIPFKKNFLIEKKRDVDDSDDHNQILEGIYKSFAFLFLDSILYYTVEGAMTTESQTTGGGGTTGGLSLGGAVVGGLLFGPVGMIIGSRKKTTINEVKTETYTKDNRKLVLYYSSGTTTKKIEFSPDDYATLKAFLPDYDLDVVNQRQAIKSKGEKSIIKEIPEISTSKTDKIRELKALLDENAIDEIEFEKLKKEIIGQ